MNNKTTKDRIERLIKEYTTTELDKKILEMELEALVTHSQLEYIQGKQL